MLFTGKRQAVVDSQGIPVRQNDGQIRFGKEFAESTFRKVYHALQTLHVHFQQVNEYKVIQVISDYYIIDNDNYNFLD